MTHPIQARIGILRRRVRGLLVVYGAGWWLACAVGVVALAGTIDYLIRFREPGMRVLVTLAVLGVFAGAAFRFLLPVGRMRFSDVALARRVQSYFPRLGEDLASAVEFLRQEQDDPAAGSAELRRALVDRVSDTARELDFRQVVHGRAAWQAGLAGGVAVLLAAAIVLAYPQPARTAVLRLAFPWAKIPWPQMHHLEIRNPILRLARGQAFEVEVIDAFGFRLPSDARIFYRFERDEGPMLESEPMRLVQGMLVARRERVTRSFSFRVEGGDDRSMPWQAVEVVDPPAVASLEATLTPPAYTGWPAMTAEGNIRALAGTRVEIAATATKPLASALLQLDGETSWPARLESSGLRLVVPGDPKASWVLERSGSYGFRLLDREGITNVEDARWEIRVVADAPPHVVWEEPDAASDPLVTPAAEVPIAVTVSDDLAIHRVDLCFTRSDRPNDPPTRTALYVGPPSPHGFDPNKVLDHATADRRSLRTVWKLDALKATPGAQMDCWIEAADYKPQTAKSETRRLFLATPEELVQRLVSREAEILAELSRTLAMQRRGREQVGQLEQRAAKHARLEQQDIDRLRGIELDQRQIQRSLADRAEGVPARILRVLAETSRNKLSLPEMKQRLEKILSTLEHLAASELPGVGRELTAAIKAAQAQLDSRTTELSATAVRTPLAAAGKHQDAIIAALAEMTEVLGRASQLREFSREFEALVQQQEGLADRTNQLARQTLARPLENLTPQEAAQLADAARGQAELADRLERTEKAMDEALRQAAQEQAAANVSEGLRRARELELAGPMRSAAEQIRRNQLGQATENQQRARKGLREIADLLAGRRRPPTDELPQIIDAPSLDEIKRAQEAINRRTKELDQLIKGLDPTSPETRQRFEQLSREQAELAEKLRGLFAPTRAQEGKP